MQISIYLTFDGCCEAAFDYYARCLGGRISMVTRHEEVTPPADLHPGWGGKIMHTELVVGD